MDIETQAEAILRDAEYTTWRWTGGRHPVVCFEDGVLMGFLHVFPDVQELVGNWQVAETTVLSAHALQLRRAGEKAWNVYSIFVTASAADVETARQVAKIEENLQRTRKMTHVGILSREQIEAALAAILPLARVQQSFEDDLEERIRKKLADVPRAALNAFFSSAEPSDVCRMLGEAE
jgi:hypothetical protein